MGILADDVLAEEGVDEAHDPDNADEDLVQHGELVAVLSTVLTLRPIVKREIIVTTRGGQNDDFRPLSYTLHGGKGHGVQG